MGWETRRPLHLFYLLIIPSFQPLLLYVCLSSSFNWDKSDGDVAQHGRKWPRKNNFFKQFLAYLRIFKAGLHHAA